VHLLESGSDTLHELLDLSSRVDSNPTRERGLKSAAFHPGFEENGMLFLVYDNTIDEESRAGTGHVTRYTADPNDLRAGLEEQEVVLEINFPGNWFHNMAGLKFGPDGMLYVGVGDGGKWRMDAQHLDNLWGSILRIDVDGDIGYEIPDDNPFVDDPEKKDEIWLYGLRNPWRFDFQPETQDLFIANTGEDHVESVYLYPTDGDTPRNHGWPFFEGNQTLEDDENSPDGINFPIVNYLREDTGGCAIIGGAVYEGDLFPELQGKFVFADYCTAQLMFTQHVDGDWSWTEWFSLSGNWFGVTSVDTDHDGELLVSTITGQLYRIVPANT
jgi:glucose/arabinose dehydrogenase